jgi:hypothetical protein
MGTNDALQWATGAESADRRIHIAVYGSTSALCGRAVPPWPRSDFCDDHRKACSPCIEKLIFRKRDENTKEG